MLSDRPVHPVLLSMDLDATRTFYRDRLGLEVIREDDDAIEFRCGDGTKLVVTRSTIGTADAQTKVRWEVPDLRAELDELRARGITIEEYDLPGLKTDDGIADFGVAWIAWIVDPASNALAVLQWKAGPAAASAAA